MVKVKICGITNLEDAVKACECGADLLGFIFIENTPRYVNSETVKDIVSDLPGQLKEKTGKVGLFKNEKLEKVIETFLYCDLDYVQLQGEEPPDYCQALKELIFGQDLANIIKAFKVEEKILPLGKYGPGDYKAADFFVFDTYHPEIAGGTGEKFDWRVLKKENIEKDFFIAGGLTPENVSEAVNIIRPYGVDVSSGVEKSPGKKDEKLLKEFIQNAKKE